MFQRILIGALYSNYRMTERILFPFFQLCTVELVVFQVNNSKQVAYSLI